jgi:hypothetical protein
MNTIFYTLLFFISVNLNAQNFWAKIASFEDHPTALAFNESGRMFLGTFNVLISPPRYHIYVSDDFGINWIKSDSGISFINYYVQKFEIGNNGVVYAAIGNAGLYKTSDSGFSWYQLNVNPNHSYFNSVLYTSLDILFCVDDNFIYRSLDNGTSWETDSLILPSGANIGGWSLFESKSGDIFAGSYCGLFKSTDNGDNWNFLESFECGDITSFAEKNDNEILIGGVDRFQGIYKSTDDGTTWVNIFNLQIPLYTNSILTLPDDKIIISSRWNDQIGGIYITSTDDTTWMQVNSGLDDNISFGLELFDGFLYSIGKYEIYKSIKQLTNIETGIPIIIDEFRLNQNFPNPFNPSTKISWQSPVGSHQTLKVYDVLGNEVATLVNEYRNAGSYEFDFNTSSLSSGIYFYRLSAGSYTQTKKMTLLK